MGDRRYEAAVAVLPTDGLVMKPWPMRTGLRRRDCVVALTDQAVHLVVGKAVQTFPLASISRTTRLDTRRWAQLALHLTTSTQVGAEVILIQTPREKANRAGGERLVAAIEAAALASRSEDG